MRGMATPCAEDSTSQLSSSSSPSSGSYSVSVYLSSPWCFLNLGEAGVDTWLFNGWTLTVANSQYFHQSVISLCSNPYTLQKEDSLINGANSINLWLYNIYILGKWADNITIESGAVILFKGGSVVGKCSTTELYSQPLILSSFYCLKISYMHLMCFAPTHLLLHLLQFSPIFLLSRSLPTLWTFYKPTDFL